MTNTTKGIAGGAAVFVAGMIAAVTLTSGSAADSDVRFMVDAGTGEILHLVPAQYEKCDGGVCSTPGNVAVQSTAPVKLEPCDEDQHAEYSAMQAAQQSAAMDYADQLEDMKDQLAADALHAQGIDPPAEAKKLYLSKGKITDKKPTAVAID